MIVTRFVVIRPFLLSVLVVSALSSKVLHLYQHVDSIPPLLLALYFPTFFILEILLFTAAWFLSARTYGVKSVVSTAIVGLLAIITMVAAASQIGFFLVTGSEVRWNAAKSVGDDPEGRKLMLSGLRPVLYSGLFLLALSSLLDNIIFSTMSRWLSPLCNGTGSDDADLQLPVSSMKRSHRQPRRYGTLFAAMFVAVLWLIRPSEPYNHISSALPFSVFSALLSSNEQKTLAIVGPHHQFPYPELLEPEFWEIPHGHYRGWAPVLQHFDQAERYSDKLPLWASADMPRGFERWSQAAEKVMWSEGEEFNGNQNISNATEESPNFYSPIIDPLRITNLDSKPFEPLEKALRQHDIPITHVVLVIMESARNDIFPFRNGSRLHQKILETYEDDESAIEELNTKLSHMTPIAQILTGQPSGFGESNDLSMGEWEDSAEPGMGGINVNGMLTGSSLSFKSALVNYCGVGPLPVDFMIEAQSDIYQPCVMQLFRLFNKLKEKDVFLDNQTALPFQSRQWTSVFTQSITELYDKQDILNHHMGFDKSICREHIEDQDSEHYHDGMESINYFGYPETEVYPYLQDVIDDTVKENKRLFLSHFTSTTHHPWSTPEDFPDEHYIADDLLNSHTDMNKYLNTVRYVDGWLGKFMKLLDDKGIANETLVVFVGDHGQAFKEDHSRSGTYENGHISNFRIPVVFRHPLLPRMQVNAHGTTMSVVPTILDLLVQTKSLNKADSDIALDIMNEYEGQSLIRPYKAQHNGRQAWNFGIINAGGTMLSVTSAASQYRLILPLTDDFEYAFTDLDRDPAEESIIKAWDMTSLAGRLQEEYGQRAAEWAQQAKEVGLWWAEERKRLWNYHKTIG